MTLPGVTVGCAGTIDPTCDYFLLHVRTAHTMFVEITVTADDASSDPSLFLYRSGLPAGRSLGSGPVETLTFAHYGTSLYEVRIQGTVLAGVSSYSATAAITGPVGGSDPEFECSEYIPGAVSHPAVTVLPGEDGRVISLDVAVVVDTHITSGSNEIPSSLAVDRAPEVMAQAAQAYAPLNIDLNPVSFTPVNVTGDDTVSLMSQAMAFLGGSRPANADVVYVMTPQDIAGGGDYAVAGQARCIGGVEYDSLAIAVGEVSDDEPFNFGLRFYTRLSAKIAGHEIGHLMAAHHHYGNCAENIAAIADFRADPCTLMSPLADFLDLRFGLLEGLVIRGKAIQHAQP